MAYQTRVVDQELDELHPQLPAIAIQGPKGVGKTATALQRATSVLALDQKIERTLLASDPSRLRALPGPVLVDEWQRYPPVWDLVRRDVDDGAEAGRYLLTGSAAPVGAPIHSGAGRIVSLRMRPMALSERQLAEPTVSLDQLLLGPAHSGARIQGESQLTITDYVKEICASGLPGLRGLSARARRAELDSYLGNVVTKEFPEQGLVVRRPETLRGWLRAYAAGTATTASYTMLLAAATPGQADKPARATITSYRDVLDQLWLLDPLPAWLPQSNALARLGKASKHFLADPALAARLLDVTEADLLSGATPAHGGLGNEPHIRPLFEHLVALSVLVYAGASEARVGHLRTGEGNHEIDLIVERRNRVVALEVKLTADVTDSDVRHLHWLRERIGDRLAASVVVTAGRHAYRRPDGVIVVPAALLGP